ncbi:hypothetical protein AVEN_190869-1 [Araneus ventricosus]|uniref:Uncharacterized protein n=1 Tax=Araneus ventricosus TaxID=182803 RepID=A0A4Y2CR98_ARAVE|nr:hypothetical protein AVEN_190869-1 [Araneus ventricosus]
MIFCREIKAVIDIANKELLVGNQKLEFEEYLPTNVNREESIDCDIFENDKNNNKNFDEQVNNNNGQKTNISEETNYGQNVKIANSIIGQPTNPQISITTKKNPTNFQQK